MSDSNPIDALNALEAEAIAAAESAPDSDALETVRVTYLGRSEGRISAILRGLGQLPAEDRPAVGQRANQVKAAEKALDAVKKVVPGVPKLGGSDSGSGAPKAEDAVKGLKKLFGN